MKYPARCFFHEIVILMLLCVYQPVNWFIVLLKHNLVCFHAFLLLTRSVKPRGHEA